MLKNRLLLCVQTNITFLCNSFISTDYLTKIVAFCYINEVRHRLVFVFFHFAFSYVTICYKAMGSNYKLLRILCHSFSKYAIIISTLGHQHEIKLLIFLSSWLYLHLTYNSSRYDKEIYTNILRTKTNEHFQSIFFVFSLDYKKNLNGRYV